MQLKLVTFVLFMQSLVLWSSAGMSLRLLSFGRVGRLAQAQWNTATVAVVKNKTDTRRFASAALKGERPNKFTPSGIKHHYELFPLVGFVSGAVVVLCSFMIYFWNSRPELQIMRNWDKTIMANMDLTNPPHLKLVNPGNEAKLLDPELVNLLKEIKEAEALAKANKE